MARYNRFMGEYNENTTYEKGDVVTFDGAAYYRKMPGSGISPIARKKPYTVWSRLNEDLSTIFPLGGGGGTGTGLPSDVGAYKYMATDGSGEWVPVDRLGWKETGLIDVITEQSVVVEADEGLGFANLPYNDISFEEGKEYIVIFDENEYKCTASTSEAGSVFIGNGYIVGIASDNGMPFMIDFYSDITRHDFTLITLSEGQHSVGVSTQGDVYQPIPAGYMPVFNASKEVRGAPLPSEILSTISTELKIGVTTKGTVHSRKGVFDLIEGDGLHYQRTLRLYLENTYKELDGTSYEDWFAFNSMYGLCEVRCFYDGDSDDAILTDVETRYPYQLRIRSSGNKTFEITVSNSGTLTATEVTE